MSEASLDLPQAQSVTINAAKNIRLIGLADSPGHGDCVKSPSVALLVSASAPAKGVALLPT